MKEIVEVAFKEGGKQYFFEPAEGENYEEGEGVVVETSSGPAYGIVAAPRHEVEDGEVVAPLRPVIRKATEQDTKRYETNLIRGSEAMAAVREKADELELNMKILDCEFAFDGNKMSVYYSAPSRVDFRELVRSLSQIYKTRIEMRQLTPREEIKMCGGFGPCGRECCCLSCIKDPKRVSIKMAKSQGLSLNPSKISGLCGKLMCCLAYESDYYTEASSHMPKMGSTVSTPEGDAVVVGTNMLKMEVSVRIDDKTKDVSTYRTFPLRELRFRGTDTDPYFTEPEPEAEEAEIEPEAEEPYVFETFEMINEEIASKSKKKPKKGKPKPPVNAKRSKKPLAKQKPKKPQNQEGGNLSS